MADRQLHHVDAPWSNLELKARCQNLAAARSAAIRLGALPTSLLVQTDTYFAVPSGRLKLREFPSGPAQLIAYDRADEPGVRTSRYHIVCVDDPRTLKAALASVLGIAAVVRKRRELLVWHNVRIHLDQVENLGNFIEFEAVLMDGDEPTSLAQLQRLAAELQIRPEDRVCSSYGNLIQSKTPR